MFLASIYLDLIYAVELECEHEGGAYAWFGDKIYLAIELLDDCFANAEAQAQDRPRTG